MKAEKQKQTENGKSRGHILTVVLVTSAFILITVLATFTVLYRYTQSAKLSLENTREEILYEAPTDVETEQGNGGENAGN